MKKYTFIVGMLLCSAVLAGCVNNNDEPKPAEKTKIRLLLTAGILGTNDTKTDISDPANPVWSDNDEIGVFISSGNEFISQNDYLITYSGGPTATFEGDVYGSYNDISDDTYDLYGYYPWGYEANRASEPTSVEIEIPATQIPTATSCDPYADIMAMKPAVITVSDQYVSDEGLQFKRMLGYVRIVLTGEGLGGESINSLNFTTDDPEIGLAGIAAFDLVEGQFIEFVDTPSTTVTANFDAEVYANGEDCIYLCIPAVTFPVGTTLTVTGSTASWMFSKSYRVAGKPIMLGAGGYHTMNITLADSDIEEFRIPVTHVEITPASLSLVEGNTGKFYANVKPNQATNKAVVWRSDNEAVATVDQNGNVTAVAPGSTIITVTTDEGSYTASGSVTVRAASNIQWARSNIVWIVDDAQPDGGYLTFAVTSEDNARIAANVGGLYFKWGSLVALSLAGTTYSSANDIIFSPKGVYNYTWTLIPSLSGNSAAPFDNNVQDEDDFATYNDGIGYDETTDTGDICRYISARGWVDGNWRMPTAAESDEMFKAGKVTFGGTGNMTINANGTNEYGFSQINYGYFIGAGVTASDNKTNPMNGIALPHAGIRNASSGKKESAGSISDYFSASSNGTDVWALDYFWGMNGVSKIARNTGASVRCVRDL